MDIYVNHSGILFRDVTTVGIYESSGYFMCKLQQIFTITQFVTKFCSGRHLVMLQEFMKV